MIIDLYFLPLLTYEFNNFLLYYMIMCTQSPQESHMLIFKYLHSSKS